MNVMEVRYVDTPFQNNVIKGIEACICDTLVHWCRELSVLMRYMKWMGIVVSFYDLQYQLQRRMQLSERYE